jgi:predicted nuclease of predicted toxin-antitoxin system
VKVRLYLDEDAMDDDLAQALRTRGVDVITTLEAGMIESPDEEQLRWATAHDRVLYTFNVQDFHRLHATWLSQGGSHAGMILTPQRRYSIGEQMRRILRLINMLSAEDMRGRAEFLSSWG